MANALSYDKWNVIDGVSSDDDESKGAARPLLAGGKSHAQHQADEAMYEAFKERFKEHFKGRAPLRQRKLLARFVAMQHRYAEPSNTFRYADIIGIVTQRQEELMEPSCVSLLCDLQKALLKQAQPEGGAPEDAAARAHAQIAMEASMLRGRRRLPLRTSLDRSWRPPLRRSTRSRRCSGTNPSRRSSRSSVSPPRCETQVLALARCSPHTRHSNSTRHSTRM